jgi:predicted nucleic acid-binding protein
MTPPAPEAATPLAVLDTNVCLDLLLFADPRAAQLHAALQAGALRAVTDADCRAEWRCVLAYPQWALDATAQAEHLARFDALVDGGATVDRATWPRPPRCRDPDDQKFLELAARAGARWLFTRDDALLRLSRRTQREMGLAIVTPEAWARQPAA